MWNCHWNCHSDALADLPWGAGSRSASWSTHMSSNSKIWNCHSDLLADVPRMVDLPVDLPIWAQTVKIWNCHSDLLPRVDLPLLNTLYISCFASQKVLSFIWKTNNEKANYPVDPSKSVIYSALCNYFLTSLKLWKALVHINGDGTSKTFPFIFSKKRVDQGIGRRGLWLVSFGQLHGTDWQGSCHQDVWQTLDNLIKELH